MINVVCAVENEQIFLFIELEQHKNRILGINQHYKNVAINSDKLFITLHTQLESVEKAQDLLLEALTSIEQEKSHLNIHEIYTIFSEENTAFYIKDMAEIVFKSPTPIQIITLLEYLYSYKEYFKEKQFNFTAYSQKEVEERIDEKKIQDNKKKEKEEHEKSYYEKVLEVLRGKRSGFTKEEEEEFKDKLKIIKDYSIFGEESSYKQKALEQIKYITNQIKISNDNNYMHTAFKILVGLGIFNSDENLFIPKYKLPLSFPDEIKEELKELHHLWDFKKTLDDRKDLTALKTISIDGEDTKDFDDAISLEEIENGYRVYTHITDMSFWIKPATELDLQAKLRIRSLYLPDLTIPMFPYEISEGIASLKQNENKVALTTCFDLDKDFNILDYHIYESVINVDCNYTYLAVDEILKEKDHLEYDYFSIFYNMALSLQHKRVEKQGGIEFLFPNINARVIENSILLKVFNPKAPAMFLVKEWMIMANYAAAHFAYNNSIPFLYLNQDLPNDEIKIENPYIETKADLFSVLRHMKKSYFSTHCSHHYALGLDSYTQTTSPIRRYIDLVLQRQLVHFMREIPYIYTENDLEEIKVLLESQKNTFNTIETESNKYYLLKYLLIHYKNKLLEGIIIKDLGQKEYLVEIFMTLNVVKVTSNIALDSLSVVKVRLHTIVPRLGIALGIVEAEK